MRDADGSSGSTASRSSAPTARATYQLATRRRRPRLRDHARHPRLRPPAERGAAPAHRTGARRRAARGDPPRAAPRRRRQEALEARRARVGRGPPRARGSRRRRCARTSRSSGCPQHDVHLDLARIRRLAIEAIAAMADDELAARGGGAARARPRAPRRPHLVEARAIARQILEPAPVALPEEARPTLERFVELRERGAGPPRRGGRARDRARAEGRRRRPAGAAARAHRRASVARSCGPSSPHSRATRRCARVQRALPAANTAMTVRRLRSTMRLYDTLTRSSSSRPARAGRDVRLRPDRLPARPHRQRAAVRRLRVAARAGCASAGYDGHARPQHHGRQRQDLRGRARARAPQRAPRRREWYLEDTARFGLGMPDVEPKATETIPEIVALIEELVARGHAYAVGRRRLLPRRALRRATARLSGQRPDQVRGAGAEPAQGGSARLRALEGDEGGRGHVVGLALGRAAGRAGTSSARRWPRRRSGRSSRSTAAGSTSSSRTTRTSSRSRTPSATRSRGSGCTTGCSGSPARRCRSRSATSPRSARCSSAWGRETVLLFFLTGALAQADRLLRRDDGRRRARRPRRSATRFRGDDRGDGGDWDAFAAALDDDFNTPGSARGPARAGRARARSTCFGAASTSSGSAALGEVDEAPAEVVGARARRVSRRAPRATSPRPTACATRSTRPAGRCATWPSRASSSSRARDSRARLRAQRRARGAARPTRGARAVGDRAGRGDARRGCARGRGLQVQRERELTEAAGTRDHQGVVAWCEPYPYADAWELAAPSRAAARLPRPGHRPAQPRRRDPPRGRRRARPA